MKVHAIEHTLADIPQESEEDQSRDLLAHYVAHARNITLAEPYRSEAYPEALYLFEVASDSDIASILVTAAEEAALSLMQKMDGSGGFAMEDAKWKMVELDSGRPGVYMGVGYAKEVDGPNKFATIDKRQVIYVGSGTSMSKADRQGGWNTGLAARVWLCHYVCILISSSIT